MGVADGIKVAATEYAKIWAKPLEHSLSIDVGVGRVQPKPIALDPFVHRLGELERVVPTLRGWSGLMARREITRFQFLIDAVRTEINHLETFRFSFNFTDCYLYRYRPVAITLLDFIEHQQKSASRLTRYYFNPFYRSVVLHPWETAVITLLIGTAILAVYGIVKDFSERSRRYTIPPVR